MATKKKKAPAKKAGARKGKKATAKRGAPKKNTGKGGG
jgi:hypothetical protein